MPRHAESRESDYSPEQLFDLVLDVEKYPDFLPWCLGASITKRGVESLEADLAIGFRKLRAQYGSYVKYTRPSRIDVSLAYGPFRHLVNHWRFSELACERTAITFEVDFEFRSTLLSAVMTPLFGAAVKRMVHEFERRARHLYPLPPARRLRSSSQAPM